MPLEILPDLVVHDFDRGAFRVGAKDRHGEVICYVSDEAIRDGTGIFDDVTVLRQVLADKIHVFAALIEAKYLRDAREPDGSIVIRSSDLG